jgi:flagellar biogenesis protein FliO
VIRAFVVAALLLTATVALSAPVELDGSGNTRVTIVAAGVKASGAVVAHGDALEIPLAASDASAHIDADDATVKHIDLIGGAHPRLIVRLHHSKHTTERIAAATIAEDANGGLKLIIPRQAGASAAVAPAPAMAAPVDNRRRPAASEVPAVAAIPVAAAAIAAPALAATPVIKAIETAPVFKAAAPSAKARELAPVAAAAQPIKAEAAVKTPAPILIVPAEQLGIPLAAPVSTDSLLDDHKSSPRAAWWVLVALIVGVPALMFAQKRRGVVKTQQPLLRVLASQSLGGKAKLMIVEADGKRILLAVNDQTTRVVANLEAAVAAVGARSDSGNDDDNANDANDANDDLDLPIDEAPARAESSFSSELERHVESLRSESAVVHLTSTTASVPSLSTSSSSSNSAIAGLLKLRADANAETASNGGPTEWGDAQRRAAGRVKS